MKRGQKEIVDKFENNARPVDMVSYIMLKDILDVLKDIRKELKDGNNT